MVNQVQCLRICLFIYSTVNWLASIIVLFYIALAQTDKDTIEVLVNNNSFRHSFIIILFCATLISVIGIVGCWGALDIRRIALWLYMIILSIMVILEISALILAFKWGKTMVKDLKNSTIQTIYIGYTEKNKTIASQAIDVAQNEFRCCGEKHYLDWLNSTWWEEERRQNSTAVVPKSCCIRQTYNACNTGQPPYKDVFFKKEINTNGCWNRLMEWVETKKVIFILLSSSFVILFTGGVICTIYLLWISGMIKIK